MKNVVIAASLLALLVPGCIVVDDEATPPCEVGECPDAVADSSPQDTARDTTVDSTIDDTGVVDSTSDDTGTVVEDSSADSTVDSTLETSTDVGVDTSVADTGVDSAPGETEPADTGSPDTFVADTNVEDTSPADTAVADTGSTDASDASDSAGDATTPTCPTGRGSEMVRVTSSGEAGSYSFCVDKHEATNAEYAAFLAAEPPYTDQPLDCATNITYTPSAAWPAASADDNRPVVHVDWCDAAAYCKWTGKRLCGKIGGGSFGAGTAENADPNVSEWNNACRGGTSLTNLYPYGATYDATACMGNGRTPAATVNVGSLSTCQGGYTGLFDMSGNVYEWLNACLAGASSNCIIAGGSFKSGSGSLACGTKNTKAKNVGADDTGIRCCAD